MTSSVRRLLLSTPTIASSIALALTASAAFAQPLDEAAYVREVLSSGPAAALLDAEQAQESAQLSSLGLWPNPSLEWQRESLGAGTGPSGGAQDNFVLSVPLVLSGRTFLEGKAKDAHREAADLRLRHQRAVLAREALLRFRRLRASELRARALSDSLRVLREVRDIAAAREKAGESSGYDTIRVALEAAAVEREWVEAKIAFGSALADALALLPADRELSTESSSPPLAPSEQALQADLRALERDIASSEAAERAAGRGFIPELTLSGGAQAFRLGQDQTRWGYVVGLSVPLPLPLFQHGQDKHEQSRGRRLVSEARRAALARELILRLKAASDELAARRKQADQHRADVEQRAAELRRIARASYEGGEANLLVLVDAERSWREAQSAAAELSVQLKRAELDVALLSGRLNVDGAGAPNP